MCGIAGIHNPSNPRARDDLARTSASMASRGPDAEGSWWSANSRVGLAHRRLAIIDPGARADQPMADPSGRYRIVFNGEIYNYRELRRELSDQGCRFTTRSDTEVLLCSYARWGADCLGRLRGMFAFAVWDDLEQRLFLARDPYGIKPLYFSFRGGEFRFASQVRALLAGGVSAAPGAAGLAGFLMLGSVPEPHTAYRDIRALPAGCFLHVGADGIDEPRSFFSVRAVWEAAANEPVRCSAAELAERMRSALVDTVKSHLVADVPVGVFLSAGMDSGSLLAFASQVGGALQSVTLGFTRFRGRDEDETALAARVAAHYHSPHTIRWLSDDDALALLPQALSAMDQPSIDGINSWLVSAAAREAGLKVVLSGVGGDELFGGYSHFAALPRWRRHLAPLTRLPPLMTLASALLGTLARWQVVPPKAPAVTRYGNSYAALYLARRGLFMPWELGELLGEQLALEGLAELDPPGFIADQARLARDNGYAAVAALEATFYLRNQLLRDADWATMAHSLELRTPLVDARLLSCLAPLLVGQPRGFSPKSALAKAADRPLPGDILRRPKTGFALPMAAWVERSEELADWRRVPALAEKNCHWARRMAYALAARQLSGARDR